MGIPLLRGRVFRAADTEETPRVFVIDEEMANRHWPDEDPIGKRVAFWWGEADLSCATACC